ncbi:uncharacterized protein LOC143025808 [Oratosquilla oratoria]|uniref:uncharacterized protein LOC143025808 n=1 Tax=Oratosquilla oratoria TaxID=337810 RepID=UPI003F7717E4
MASVVLSQPALTLSAIVNVPISTDADRDGEETPRKLIFLAFYFTFYLDSLMDQYAKGRSLSDDQLSLYSTLEERLASNYGIDGRACVLRFICELQKHSIRDFTVMGEIVTSLFQPREGSFLQEYRTARSIGLSVDSECSHHYYSCPISVFNLFYSYVEENEVQNEFCQGDVCS